ncbi:MAG: hypothetical protein FWD47_15610, partial [Treponema sp.]|nr:hypothetical protein [Treponema sp.]
LFDELDKFFTTSQRGQDSSEVNNIIKEAPLMETFFNFIKNTNYDADTPSWRVVTDYIAGMTDHFAQKTFTQLFTPTPVV